ncbi:MAG: hypothetical protein LAT56_16230 [Wenzhouxiangella sp.]|nr:hypothetical protein [Wenzhouxiangella sp.]
MFQPNWDSLNQLPGAEGWQERFQRVYRAANAALARRDTGTVLGVIFTRLYTLRNQLIHGGATWNSRVNREQLRDVNAIVGELVG